MSKFLRAVTALLVTLALATAASAQQFSQPYAIPGYPVQDYGANNSVTSATTLLPSMAVGGYKSFNMQFTSIGAGNTVLPEMSNDGTNFVGAFCSQATDLDAAATQGAIALSATSVVYSCSTPMRFFKLSVSVYGSGTVTLKGNFRDHRPEGTANVVATVQASGVTDAVNLAQVGGTTVVTGGVAGTQGIGGTAADDAAATGNPVQIGCKFNTAANTIEDGDIGYVNCTSKGSVIVEGPAADDAAASGNPVPVGGIYNTTLPTYSNLDRTQLQQNARGMVMGSIYDPIGGTGMTVSASPEQTGISFGFGRAWTWNTPYISNGTTLETQRSVINATDSTGTGIAAAGILAQCDETSPTATTENQFGNLTLNCATGALKVERDGDLFLNIVLAAPTTTVVKSGAGRFHKLCINKPAATGVITMYDNTAASGTLIGTITQPAALLSSGPICIAYDLTFGTGLTIVTATAAQDLTITYR